MRNVLTSSLMCKLGLNLLPYGDGWTMVWLTGTRRLTLTTRNAKCLGHSSFKNMHAQCSSCHQKSVLAGGKLPAKVSAIWKANPSTWKPLGWPGAYEVWKFRLKMLMCKPDWVWNHRNHLGGGLLQHVHFELYIWRIGMETWWDQDGIGYRGCFFKTIFLETRGQYALQTVMSPCS